MSMMAFDIQSFQGAGRRGLRGLISGSPPSRLLNLHALRRSEPTDPDYAARPFFLQPILNRSIIVKHNMRHGEEGLDGRRQLNALKLIFALDAANLSFGAQSLLTSQCDLMSIFRQSFESVQPSTDRDLKLIGLLEDAPTLDPFLLQEIARQYALDIAPCYFTTNRKLLDQHSAIVSAQANAILELFGSKAPFINGQGDAHSEINEIQNQEPFNLECAANEYECRGKILSEYFFSWKIVIFYRWRLKDLISTSNRLLISLEHLRSNIGPPQTTPLTERTRRRVYDALASALSEAQAIVEDYDTLYYAVLSSARADLFRALLCQSKMYLLSMGARISRLDDALGFWSSHAPGGPDRVEVYTLESFMLAFERHIATDLPLPKFAPAAPKLGLRDRRTPASAATTPLRSDLPG